MQNLYLKKHYEKQCDSLRVLIIQLCELRNQQLINFVFEAGQLLSHFIYFLF